MPNRNQTGPLGGGPKTGRGLGLCSGIAERADPRGTGRGMGRGRGNGWCTGRQNGRGNGWGARGLARWFTDMGTKMQAGLSSQAKDGCLASVATDADRQDPERQAGWLREQLHQVEERLNVTKKE